MSFEAVEISESAGELVQYFKFTVGATVYRWNSSARTLTIPDGSYTAHPIALSEPEHGRDSSSMRVRISVPRDNAVALLFRSAIPDTQIPVTVSMKHTSDAEVVGAWSGTVLSCEWRESEASLLCELNLAKMKRLGLRQRFQPTCNLETYSTRCGLNRNDYKSSVTVSAVSGLTVTVSGMPAVADGYYNGGYAQAADGTRRFIAEHVGSVLTLLLPFETLAVSAALDIFAGDDHTHETCRTKFTVGKPAGRGNIDNFFGFFTTPGRNPFTQGGLTGGGGAGAGGGNGIIPG